MIDIVNRLRFDATRCEVQFSKGVARNIDAAADEIERLRKKLEEIHDITQDTTLHVECWQKLQNIAATAASALTPSHRADADVGGGK